MIQPAEKCKKRGNLNRVQERLTWVELDETGCAVSEVAARFGRALLHLRQNERTHQHSDDNIIPSQPTGRGGGGGRGRAPHTYLDGDVCRVGAIPTALDLDLKSPRGLAGSVAGRRQLHLRPRQLQSAGQSFMYFKDVRLQTSPVYILSCLFI